MSGRLRKVRPGEPLRIPASAYNAFVDAARHAQRFEADARRDPAAGGGVGHGREQLVLVRNDSGLELPRYGVLGIDGPVIEPVDGEENAEFKRRPTLIGAAITEAADYAGRFVVALAPIRPGELGPAVLRGVTAALINIIDELHTHADTFPNEQLLRSGFTGGAKILWKPPGTGELLAVVETGPVARDRFAARLIEAHAIEGRPFGWLYDWEEVRLQADPVAETFGQYVRPETVSEGELGNGVGWLASDGRDELRAFNRYEAHLSVVHPQPDDGIEGFAHAGACLVPGALEACPPGRAMVPMLLPIPQGVVVELRAERTLGGESRFVFEALNPVELREFEVPGEHYA